MGNDRNDRHLGRQENHDPDLASAVNTPYLHYWVPANKLSKNEHLKAPGGQVVTAEGGTTPKDHDGWMWDLTVQDDHDFYVEPAAVLPPTRAGPTPIPVLVHNCGGTVYRVIRPDEDPSAGLFPKNPDANVSVDEHVRFGSRPGFEVSIQALAIWVALGDRWLRFGCVPAVGVPSCVACGMI